MGAESYWLKIKGYLQTAHYPVLFVLIYLVIFLKLGNFPMRWWDESMFAVNTYEMMHNGNWFSLYYNGVPDLFNTKPPLTCWLQIIFVKLGGYNEISLRLPSALAAGISVLVLFRFVSRRVDFLAAWISALILLTSYGFIHFHTARTADSDSLLTLFLLLSTIAGYRFIFESSRISIAYFFVFLTLAFATKLFAALLFIPGSFFLLIYFRKLSFCLKSVWFWIGISVFLFSAFMLIWLREQDAPGYWNQLIQKDAGRVTAEIEGHAEPAFYYLDNLAGSRFSLWFVFASLGMVLTFFRQKDTFRNILIVFGVLVLGYLAVITLSVTKLAWYDMPLFPLLALLAAYPVYLLLDQLFYQGKPVQVWAKYLVMAGVFLYPYSIMFSKSQGNSMGLGEHELEANELFLYKKIEQGENLDGVTVFYRSWNGSLLFYQYRLAEVNQHIRLTSDLADVSADDRVLVCDESLLEELQAAFEIRQLDCVETACLFAVGEPR